MTERVDVAVVGAGLTGLAAAHRLAAAGVSVALLEAGDGPGGRVRTDVVDGFLLDRGFQVLNPSYPELHALDARGALDLAALDLRLYDAGVRVALDHGRHAVLADPRRRPTDLFATLRAPVGSLRSKLRFTAYAAGAAVADPDGDEPRPDVDTRQALASAGVGAELLDTVIGPFLAGVFLEPDLATSRRFADLVLRSFVRGTPGLPPTGVRALPDQLAARLPAGTLRTDTRVERLTPTGVASSAGRLDAAAVVVATEAPAAAHLLSAAGLDLEVPRPRVVTTWFHTPTGTDPATLSDGRPVVLVDGRRRGPVVTTSVPTAAAPSYSASGRALVSSSVLDLATGAGAERAVRAHLAQLYAVDTAGWELVGVTSVPYAQPAMTPPLDVRRPVRLGDRRYVAGDHRDTASVQGALVSGRRAADAVLADLAQP